MVIGKLINRVKRKSTQSCTFKKDKIKRVRVKIITKLIRLFSASDKLIDFIIVSSFLVKLLTVYTKIILVIKG